MTSSTRLVTDPPDSVGSSVPLAALGGPPHPMDDHGVAGLGVQTVPPTPSLAGHGVHTTDAVGGAAEAGVTIRPWFGVYLTTGFGE